MIRDNVRFRNRLEQYLLNNRWKFLTEAGGEIIYVKDGNVIYLREASVTLRPNSEEETLKAGLPAVRVTLPYSSLVAGELAEMLSIVQKVVGGVEDVMAEEEALVKWVDDQNTPLRLVAINGRTVA